MSDAPVNDEESWNERPSGAEPQEPVIIPHTELSPEALQGVIESFVLREGTEYGEKDFSLEQKLAHVLRQLERREAQIVFDPESGSINIVVVAAESRRSGPADGTNP